MERVKYHKGLVHEVAISSSGKEKNYFINGKKLDLEGIMSITTVDAAYEYPELKVEYICDIITEHDKKLLGIGHEDSNK